VFGFSRRYRVASGSGYARQFQPRRHQEFHGGDRTDFKAGYVDLLPVSNADVGVTAAKLLGLDRKPKGTLVGRVMTEAMPNGATPKGYTGTVSGKPAANGLQTVLKFQRAGSALFRCGGISGPDCWPARNNKTAGAR
jgi:hypothetical protein